MAENCEGTGEDEGPSIYGERSLIRCEFCEGTGQLPGKIDSSLLDNLSVQKGELFEGITILDEMAEVKGEFFYSSSLDYTDQLTRYKSFKKGDKDRREDDADTVEIGDEPETNLDLLREEEEE